MPVKTKKPRIGEYRALSEPTIPNTGRWLVYSKMEPICGAVSFSSVKILPAAKRKMGFQKAHAPRRWR
jgi:hypothetical protein